MIYQIISKLLPPFWIISELMTLGEVAKFYSLLDITKFNISRPSNKLDELANEFGASNVGALIGFGYF